MPNASLMQHDELVGVLTEHRIERHLNEHAINKRVLFLNVRGAVYADAQDA